MDDQSFQYNLIGELKLENVNTYYMIDQDETGTADNLRSIRVAVGWRNPQEDAYDVTAFNIIYDRDSSKVQFIPEDGYCYGSIDTALYQIDGVSTGVDENGKYNSTI